MRVDPGRRRRMGTKGAWRTGYYLLVLVHIMQLLGDLYWLMANRPPHWHTGFVTGRVWITKHSTCKYLLIHYILYSRRLFCFVLFPRSAVYQTPTQNIQPDTTSRPNLGMPPNKFSSVLLSWSGASAGEHFEISKWFA